MGRKRNSTSSVQVTIQSQRSASFGQGRFATRGNENVIDNIVNDLKGHQTTTSGLRSRIFMTQNGRGQKQLPQQQMHFDQSMSEVSLS